MESGALCSSGSAVTLLELVGDKLCSCPELSPRSDTTRPSSFGGYSHSCFDNCQLPREAKDRLL